MTSISDRNAGLSIVELLVVVVLVSVIAGIAGISYRSIWLTHQLNMASHELVQQLKLARMKAILQNQSYQVIIDNHTLLVSCLSNDIKEEVSNFQLNPSIIFRMSGILNFSAKGFASPKTITLTLSSRIRKIIVNINGRIRSE